MLAGGREPAAIETLRCDDDPLILGGGPVEDFIHRSFRQAADNSGRNEHDECKHEENGDDAFLQDTVRQKLRAGRDASMAFAVICGQSA